MIFLREGPLEIQRSFSFLREVTMGVFWWVYSILFVVAAVVKGNDTYLIAAGMFAIAAAISELGWKVRNVLDRLNEAVYGEEEEEN